MSLTDAIPDTSTDTGPPKTRTPLRRILDQHLAMWWFVLFLIGAFSIVAVRGTSVLALGSTLIPCLLLTSYTYVGFQIPKRNMTKFADSIYFMGFLWTLLALIMALIVPKQGAANVFNAFGYALFTTGLGMFWRVVVLQFHETIPDQMIDAQDLLERRLTSLAAEIDATAKRIQGFGMDATENLDSQVALVTVALTDLAGPIASFQAQLSANATAMSEESERFQQELGAYRSAFGPLEKAPGDLARLTHNIGVLNKYLVELGNETKAKADGHLSQLAEATRQLDEVRSASRSIAIGLSEILGFLQSHLKSRHV